LAFFLFLFASLLAQGCANRGMHAPSPDGGTPGQGGTGATGTGGTAGRPGAGGAGGTTGHGGSGGGTGGTGGVAGSAGGGTGGTVGSGGVAGTAGVAGSTGGGLADASADAGCNGPISSGWDGGTCTATFNFEATAQGATIPTSGQAAFTGVGISNMDTYCGLEALTISASFSGTAGTTTKGEVDIPLGTEAGAYVDLTGKTITLHFAAVPCGVDLGFAVLLLTASGSPTIVPTVRPLGNTWETASVMLTADISGVDMVSAISIQAFSSTNYQGKIFVDEIDITGP